MIGKSNKRAVSSTFKLILACISIVLPLSAHCQQYNVSQDQLGQLTVNVASVASVESYTGSKLSATVATLPGQAYTIIAPMNAQRVQFLKQRGERVAAGESMLMLIGPEVEHYYDEYELKTDLFAQTTRLYERNKKLFAQKAIGEQVWLNISEQYISQKLALGEFNHFFDYVDNFNHQIQALTLKSPIDGILNYTAFSSLLAMQEIVSVIPSEAVRVKVKLPSSQSQTPSSLQLPQCTLRVDQVEGLSQSFYKTLWSEPLSLSCNLNVGDMVIVNPQYQISAFSIPKAALFSLHGKHYVMRQTAEGFASVEVNIVASEQNSFVVTSSQDIHGSAIATSSVSALQGILMGLGE